MKVIILSLTPFKEKDAIINAISEDSFITFKARNILSLKNRNNDIKNILTVADVTFNKEVSDYNILRESSIILSPLQTNSSLEYLSVINGISEATNKLLDDEEKPHIFSNLLEAISSLKNGVNPICIALKYLYKVLKIAGYAFQINHCVKCESKQKIVGFSFVEGGFICRDCLQDGNELDLTGKYILMIREICGSSDYSNLTTEHNSEDLLFILSKFIYFINDICGLPIKSFDLILKK